MVVKGGELQQRLKKSIAIRSKQKQTQSKRVMNLLSIFRNKTYQTYQFETSGKLKEEAFWTALNDNCH